MTTLTDIQQKQQELEQMINSLKQEEAGFWKPEASEEYFYINEMGAACEEVYAKGFSFDAFNLETGNYFKTKEEAERELAKRKAIQELKELAGGYEWRNGKDNHFIRCDFGFSDDYFFEVDFMTITLDMGVIYFKTEEQAQKAIDTLGEEKLKLIFDIEG